MKKYLIIIILFCIALFGCHKKEEISIEGPNKVLEGEHIELTAVTSKSVFTCNWSSSDSSIATVNNNGDVVGIREGEVDITLKIDDLSASIKIKVEKFVISIQGDNKIQVNETTTLNVSHNSSEIKTIYFSSMDSSIASVNEFGIVKGISEGTTSININVSGHIVKHIIEVYKVNEGPAIPDNPIVNPGPVYTPLEIDIPDIISYDDVVIAQANRDVYWTSSDDNILYINENNEIVIVDMGVVTIRATDKKNKDAYVEKVVTVTSGIAPEGLEIYQSDGIYKVNISKNPMYPDSQLALSYRLLGESKECDSRVIWVSSNSAIAKVNDKGVVTGVSEGKVKITIVSAVDNNITAEIIIEVVK